VLGGFKHLSKLCCNSMYLLEDVARNHTKCRCKLIRSSRFGKTARGFPFLELIYVVHGYKYATNHLTSSSVLSVHTTHRPRVHYHLPGYTRYRQDLGR
jgi:hypothetical protein